MKKFFQHFHFSVFLIALLCVALGVAVILWPDQAMNVLGYGFGGVLVLSGILSVASYLGGERNGFLSKLQLISGIIIAVVGVWILLAPKTVAKLTVIVMGIVLLYHGVMDVKYGFDIKNCNGKHWALAVIFGLATCGVGVLILVNPFESAQVLLMVVGAGFVFDGLSDIFTVVTVAHAERKFELASAQPVIEIDPGKAEVLDPAAGAAKPADAPDAPSADGGKEN